MGKIKLLSGEQIYKYQLTKYLGGGQFGDVWLAHDASIDSMVAVKIIQSTSDQVINKLQEAQIGNRLNHPNLVKVHYADVINHKSNTLAIIAMDNYTNGSISNQINPRGFLPIPQTLKWITDVLKGLEYLHSQGFLHNDIKPSNILIGDNGEGILTDYGISCYSPNLQPVMSVSSYIIHQAPETISTGEISTLTDIYQIGMTSFRLLNGIDIISHKRCEMGDEVFRKQVVRGLITPEDYFPFIPPSLKRVINKVLNPDPTQRYQSAVEVRRALERLNFPGCWDCDKNAILFGENERDIFYFEKSEKVNGINNFTAMRKNKSSGRETKISKYCQKNLTEKEFRSLQKNFMQDVVRGSL